MSERLRSTLLAWPSGTVLQVCRGTVLDIMVDFDRLVLSALLDSWVLTEWASPFGHSQSALTTPVRERAVSRGSVYFWPEKWVGVESERRPLLGQAFRLEKRVGVGSERCPLLGQAF